MRPFRRLRFVAPLVALALLAVAPRAVSAEKLTVPLGLVGGMTRNGVPDRQTLLRVVVELKPKADLDGLAAAVANPASPLHRSPLTRAAFVARFGRPERDILTLRRFLQNSGGADVYTSQNRLVVGGVLSIAQIEHAFKTRFARYVLGERTAVAPAEPLDLPLAGIRAIRGVVAATTPRLADVPSFTIFRGDWYNPDRFRAAYDAITDGGRGMHVALVEDASDRAESADIDAFSTGAGAPRGIAAENVEEHEFAFKSPSSACGHDDRGQEPTLDIDAVLTLAPRAVVDLDYDDVCSFGNDGSIALARAFDATRLPDVVVFPFTVADENGTLAADYGPPAVTLLEAAVLGVPIVAAAGDDGAYGMRLPGQTAPGVTYPCVSPYVICAGGTQLGDRSTVIDEAIWNDGTNAGGGGVSNDPRPSWQITAGGFEFSTTFGQANRRLVPDVSADASGHLRIFWHDYEEGGIGGTSESAALVGAEIAAIDAAVPPEKRLTAPGDLYALAHTAPSAFRDVARENDRGYRTNTLHLPVKPLPVDFRGFIPTPAPLANGCNGIQQDGCQVRPGYDAVSGLGSLLESPAIAALKPPSSLPTLSPTPTATGSPTPTPTIAPTPTPRPTPTPSPTPH